MLYKDLVFDNNQTGDYLESIKQLVQLSKNINVKCENIIINNKIDVIYNKSEIYIPLDRQCDIIFNISNIDNKEHIIKKELYGGIFNEICNIEFNQDFVLPIYIVPYTEIFVKITFDDIVNIPENIKLTYMGGLLQNEYRKNRSIIYPLSKYIDNGCIIPILHGIKKFNIIIKSNEYSFPHRYIYKLVSKYDQKIQLLFGKIIIDTNLLNIDYIPCIADYNGVSIKYNSYNLELEFEIYSLSSLPLHNNKFLIDNVDIEIENGCYKVIEAR
jgi:hypothetical protein